MNGSIESCMGVKEDEASALKFNFLSGFLPFVPCRTGLSLVFLLLHIHLFIFLLFYRLIKTVQELDPQQYYSIIGWLQRRSPGNVLSLAVIGLKATYRNPKNRF